MMSVEDLKILMLEKFNIDFKLEDVSEEAVLLHHEDLDNEIVDKEYLEVLPNPVLFQTFMIEIEEEWIVGFAYPSGKYEPVYFVALQDGKKVSESHIIVEGEKQQ
jgi:hypothetical protein